MKPPLARGLGSGGGRIFQRSAILPGGTITPHLPAPQDPQDPATLTELRTQWWRQGRHGLRLPAELGIIVFNGGRP